MFFLMRKGSKYSVVEAATEQEAIAGLGRSKVCLAGDDKAKLEKKAAALQGNLDEQRANASGAGTPAGN